MHALYPTSITMICLALADPTFGKRGQTSTYPPSGEAESGAPEHTTGASEHTTGASEDISLDDAITKLKHHTEADERATEILAAATTLRDSTGRDRFQSLRQMCGSTWGVSRTIKIDGKWKDRPLKDWERELEAAVCSAAA